ncbi:MAG: glycerophosphodiester phosphodiesterase [Myxococcota bacterium]|nr:glycerophosphodiester phosphodiesterase [Myxococcota bacterium]
MHAYFDLPRPTILGHRGAAGPAPENTLVAFRRGLKDGCHAIETDAHVTRDGVPILLHDVELDRTTNGNGPVAQLDFETVRRLDAGFRYSAPPNKSPTETYRGQGVRIPSLKEAFETLPTARFNIELKAHDPSFIRHVVELIVEFDRESRTLLVAGEDRTQALLRQVLAETGAQPALGASLGDILEVVKSAVEGRRPETDSMALQIPRTFAGQPLVTPELVQHAHDHGIAVHVWTINDPVEMQTLLDLGVDGLVTDWPQRMAELIETDHA